MSEGEMAPPGLPRDFPIVDAHQHFWDPRVNYHPWLCDEPLIAFRYGDYSSIRRRFLPPDYLDAARPITVARTVYVETEWDPADPLGETRYVHELARRYGYPNAVVAQAWLDRGDIGALLEAQAAFPLVRGVRHKPAAAVKAGDASRGRRGGMDDPAWRDGFSRLSRHDLMFDLQTPWWELAAAAELAADFPETSIVLNHTGLPSDRSAEGLAGWRKGLDAVARHPNVALKISGLGLPGQPWRLHDNAPVICDAIAIFGADRCMFASNFPVDGLVASFATLFDGYYAATQGLWEEARPALFHDTAMRLYRPVALPQTSTGPKTPEATTPEPTTTGGTVT